jgi:hypothetical protein
MRIIYLQEMKSTTSCKQINVRMAAFSNYTANVMDGNQYSGSVDGVALVSARGSSSQTMPSRSNNASERSTRPASQCKVRRRRLADTKPVLCMITQRQCQLTKQQQTA